MKLKFSEMSRRLPEDIILNIFYRLPLKSVLRSRCVCKLWNMFFRDPKFVKMHLDYAIEKNHFNLMLKGLKQIYSLNFDASSTDEAVEMTHPFKCLEYEVEILASCDGLFCIAAKDGPYGHDSVIYLWNPSTQEYKEISRPPVRSSDGSSSLRVITYGFCYDFKIEDYKLIRIACFKGGSGCEVMVYTLRSNSWKIINDILYKIICKGRPAVLVNRNLHWPATPCGFPSRSKAPNVIVCFDIAEELFQEIPQPIHPRLKYFKTIVGALDGCLCVLGIHHKVHHKVDVWVMKDYGVKESWTRLFSVAEQNVFRFLWPIMSFKNGKILFEVKLLKENQHVILLFDSKSGRTRIRKTKRINKWFSTEVYVGSLVSLKSGTFVDILEQEQEATSVDVGLYL